jgi:DNA-binding CsgD family transcriptional regulator
MGLRLCPVIVGRDAELSALELALAQAASGHGRFVALVGEAGVGKSRLAREIGRWAEERGVPSVTGRAVPGSLPAPFRPMTEALLQLFRHRPLPDGRDLDTWLPLLQPLLPSLVGPSPTTDVPASVRAEAVLRLLSHANPSGVVVVLEDLHWADPDSVELVEYLAGNLGESPVVLVVTLRDSPPTPALAVVRRQRGRPDATFLALDRLDPAQAAAMVRACEPGVDSAIVDRICLASEGIPLLVEDLLASPGPPADFAATVRARLDALETGPRAVIEAAAVLGRQFDWELLGAMTETSDDAVTVALESGIELLLITSADSQFRFRHALTREAVLDTLIPPRHRELAARGLAALTSSHPDLDDAQRQLAVDLALRCADRRRAGALLAESGRRALSWGALATATEALRGAADLLADASERTAVELDLIEALGLAGRVDEAAAAGGRLLARLGGVPDATSARVEAHVRLTSAAVAASRWPMARHHLGEAHRLSVPSSGAPTDPRAAVLEADIAMAEDDYDVARALVAGVAEHLDVRPEVRCHAFEILGRCDRLVDQGAAQSAFESALVTAEAADLPLWRLRALHELGTIEMFDHAGVERLVQARDAAAEMGAVSTAATVDLQLAAAFTCRWDLSAGDEHANSALAIATSLGLEPVRAKALALLAGSAAMRADLAGTERYATLTMAAAPEDSMLDGLCWGTRGVALLLAGADEAALEPWARGTAILANVPHAEPAALRALWPLVLAAARDRRAPAAIDEARRMGVAAFALNRSLIGYAEAILAGRRGDVRRARELATLAERGWINCEGWSDLSRLLAAPHAAADGWAPVAEMLSGVADRLAQRGLVTLEGRSRTLVAGASANPWAGAGVSAREADVLELVGEGLTNKEIAARLHLSPRTVEKHIESMFRKVGAHSRTDLAARLAIGRVGGDRRPPADTT